MSRITKNMINLIMTNKCSKCLIFSILLYINAVDQIASVVDWCEKSPRWCSAFGKVINDIAAGTIYPQIINRDNQVANPYSTMLKG